MAKQEFYRGGTSFRLKRGEVIIDRRTGQVRPVRGVSVFSRPDNLERFGGAYRVANLPPELQIVQQGLDPAHFEIIPVRPMPLPDYEHALNQIVLIPVQQTGP